MHSCSVYSENLNSGIEQSVQDKKCRVLLLHPSEKLFENNARSNTGVRISDSRYADALSKEGLWNRQTFDGVIPETSIYLKSNCIINGSILRTVDVHIIERFSGKSIPVKEIYMPSRKIVKFTPLEKLRSGSLYILILTEKNTNSVIKNNNEYTYERNQDYYDRLRRIVLETSGIHENRILEIMEFAVRSTGSITGPYIRLQNMIVAEYGNSKNLFLTSAVRENGIIIIRGYFYGPEFCRGTKCKINKDRNSLSVIKGKRRINFKLVIPESAVKLKLIQFSNSPFNQKDLIFETNIFRNMLISKSISAAIITGTNFSKNYPDTDSAVYWIQSWMHSSLFSYLMIHHVTEILETKNISITDDISIAGFGSGGYSLLETQLNPFINNYISLDTYKEDEFENISFIHPESELERMNFEGLIPGSYEHGSFFSKNKKISIKSFIKYSDIDKIYFLFGN